MKFLACFGAVLLALSASAASADSFLKFPIDNANPYTAGIIAAPMDHSLVQNPNGFWQYGTNMKGSDGIVVTFNGEKIDGPLPSKSCVAGTLNLLTDPNDPNSSMINHEARSCGNGFADERPGYDYNTKWDTEIRASADGVVLDILKANGSHESCYRSNILNCNGTVGILTANGYLVQYGHLDTLKVKPGQTVKQGDVVGTSTNTLRVEVLKRVPADERTAGDQPYVVVDPYGWVGSGPDPLYSASILGIAPQNLWNTN